MKDVAPIGLVAGALLFACSGTEPNEVTWRASGGSATVGGATAATGTPASRGGDANNCVPGGGISAAGGAPVAGGTSPTSGTSPTGGATASGGTSTVGNTATNPTGGNTSGTGGFITSTGGTNAVGSDVSEGRTATGGISATGGALGLGGSSATGGKTTGGTSSVGGTTSTILAATPPMGWNSWNTFGCNLTEALIKGVADAFVSNGMKDAGYQYVNLDDCWMDGRDARGDGSGCVPGKCSLNLPTIANMWRIGFDINASWSSMVSLIDQNEPLYPYAGPGHWNDPDMMEVGRLANDTEDQAHFSMWAIMAAPLIAGNDVRSMKASTKSILTNAEVIAVDQDPLGAQGHIVAGKGTDLQVWTKRLSVANTYAVALFNRGTSAASITAQWSAIGIPAGAATVRDLWRHTDLGSFTGSYVASGVPGHGIVLLKVTTP